MHAAVVELDPLPDAVRSGAEDDDSRLVTRGQGLVGLAPGGVEVVRAGLDLAGAGVDSPKRRQHALLVPAAANLHPAHPELGSDGVVSPAGPLGAQKIAAHELRLRSLDLPAKPGMETFGQVVEAGPRCRSARIELARAECLQERLAERASDAHCLAD